MELDKLGVGSIVEVNGNLYKKRGYGWVVLEESVPAFMGGAVGYKLIHEVEKGPLDGFEVGDVISYEVSSGVRLAVKLEDGRWSVSGISSVWSSDELMEIHAATPGSVRKVGSLDGGS